MTCWRPGREGRADDTAAQVLSQRGDGVRQQLRLAGQLVEAHQHQRRSGPSAQQSRVRVPATADVRPRIVGELLDDPFGGPPGGVEHVEGVLPAIQQLQGVPDAVQAVVEAAAGAGAGRGGAAYQPLFVLRPPSRAADVQCVQDSGGTGSSAIGHEVECVPHDRP
ncbi:hypothetical protein Jiend_62900 [Micromonospora endophytica]|nr:hypothetical protein Jiend_62900 [Micromonospora endophytica]